MPATLACGWLLFAAPVQAAPAQPAPGQSATAQSATAAPSRLAEVVANIQGQPLGPGTVADLALPEDFLRRIADRVLRASFEQEFRIVVADGGHALSPREAEAVEEGVGLFRLVLRSLAVVAVLVLTVLGLFAWKARARRRE